MADESSPAQLRERVEAIIAAERGVFDVGDIVIEVQVWPLAEDGQRRYAATFGPPNPGEKAALIVVDPSAFDHPAGIEHIVRHELVHVAHGERFGDDREAAFEWLCDELARVVHENRDLDAAATLLRANGYRVLEPLKLCRDGCVVCQPDNSARTPKVDTTPHPYAGRPNGAIVEARAAEARTHPL